MENIPELEINEDLPTGNSPIAPLSTDFKAMYHKGHALPQSERKRTVYTRKQGMILYSWFL